jgi:nucleoside-diphosphate-sugar epimerase
MHVVLTGSSGRVGRAIFSALAAEGHNVIGVDVVPFSTTQVVGDCSDPELMKRVLDGADALIHSAGPHAPHVGIVSDTQFERVNVETTGELFEIAQTSGLTRFVYTSTTALYGDAVQKGQCTWITEDTEPLPGTVYHRTKLAAERLLEQFARPDLPVRVLRMSRCFPETAPVMAVHRTHRGVDVRDVASGHLYALVDQGPSFARYIISGATPFEPRDCLSLADGAPALLRECLPELAREFENRDWPLPASIDRVYGSGRAQRDLGWTPRYSWQEVIAQHDRQSLEVLPAKAAVAIKSE